MAYNALPATITADMTARQYHQQPNQVLATIAERDWTFAQDDSNIFALEPNFGCCTANLHQGWPKLVRSLWMATPDGGLAAVAYAPSTVTARVADREVTLEERTSYPFRDVVQLRVRTPSLGVFPLLLRIPAWCRGPRLRINGSDEGVDVARSGYPRLEREWRDGDEIELTFPMEVRAIERPRGALALGLGPLVLAFSPGEVWERLPGSGGFGDWEVRPRRSWNHGLEIDPRNPGAACRVEWLDVRRVPFGLRSGPPPFGVEDVPVRVFVPSRRVPSGDWSETLPLPRRPARSPPPCRPRRCRSCRTAVRGCGLPNFPGSRRTRGARSWRRQLPSRWASSGGEARREDDRDPRACRGSGAVVQTAGSGHVVVSRAMRRGGLATETGGGDA